MQLDDPEARTRFLALFEEVAGDVYVWATVRVLPELRRRLDPEDIVQEVCFRAYNTFSSFDAARGTFRGWVFGIANFTLLQELRRLRRSRHADLGSRLSSVLRGVPDAATTLCRRLAKREQVQALLAQLETLDGPDRELVLLRGIEGLPHAEVADRLGVTESAAETRWRRMRTRLADWFGQAE